MNHLLGVESNYLSFPTQLCHFLATIVFDRLLNVSVPQSPSIQHVWGEKCTSLTMCVWAKLNNIIQVKWYVFNSCYYHCHQWKENILNCLWLPSLIFSYKHLIFFFYRYKNSGKDRQTIYLYHSPKLEFHLLNSFPVKLSVIILVEMIYICATLLW